MGCVPFCPDSVPAGAASPTASAGVIHVVDSTMIHLIAPCMDWAKHRRRKAAAKCHLRLDLQSLQDAALGPFLYQIRSAGALAH
jgi:hypothetical protein